MDDKQLLLVKQSSIKKSKIIPLVPFRNLYIEKNQKLCQNQNSKWRNFAMAVILSKNQKWHIPKRAHTKKSTFQKKQIPKKGTFKKGHITEGAYS